MNKEYLLLSYISGTRCICKSVRTDPEHFWRVIIGEYDFERINVSVIKGQNVTYRFFEYAGRSIGIIIERC